MRGIPQIYYGTEILMSNKGTDSHGVIRSDFPGGWEGDSTSVLLKKNLNDKQLEALAFNKKLNHWRQSKDAIHNGKLLHFEPKDKVYTYFRFNENEKIMVILNKNKEAHSLDLARFGEIIDANNTGKDVLSDETFELNSAIELKPMRSYILELR